MIAFAKAKGIVANVFSTSSKTKLLVAITVILLAENAAVTPEEKLKWQALAGIAFIVSQGFKEAFARARA